MVREVRNRFSSMFYAKNKPIYAFRRKMGYPPNPYAKSGENLTLDRPEKIGQTGIWVPHLLSGVLVLPARTRVRVTVTVCRATRTR